MKSIEKAFMTAFYSKEVTLSEKTTSGSYRPTEVYSDIDTFYADIQPYSMQSYGAGLQKEIYGFDVSKGYRMYTSMNDKIHEGCYISNGDTHYLIVRVNKWNTGISAVLEMVEDD